MDYNKILTDSADRGDSDGVQSALRCGADVNSRDKDGNTALILVVMSEHTEIVKTLVNAGADLDIKDMYGETALLLSAWYGNTEIVQILIDAGASLDIGNHDNKTALDIAIEEGHNDTAALIKSHMKKQAERQEYAFDLNI